VERHTTDGQGNSGGDRERLRGTPYATPYSGPTESAIMPRIPVETTNGTTSTGSPSRFRMSMLDGWDRVAKS